MKVIENKTTTMKQQEGGYFTYADMCRSVLSQAPQGGFSYEEMKSRLKIEKVLDEAKKDIKLEDADHAILAKAVNEFKWAVKHDDIIAFIDAVRGAKDCAANKA